MCYKALLNHVKCKNKHKVELPRQTILRASYYLFGYWFYSVISLINNSVSYHMRCDYYLSPCTRGLVAQIYCYIFVGIFIKVICRSDICYSSETNVSIQNIFQMEN